MLVHECNICSSAVLNEIFFNFNMLRSKKEKQTMKQKKKVQYIIKKLKIKYKKPNIKFTSNCFGMKAKNNKLY